MDSRYDAIIVGSGQAGMSLAVRLAGAGMKAALVEREHFGGTCVNDGCMPTKTMVASARAAHIARRAPYFGVRIGGTVSVDMPFMKVLVDAPSLHILGAALLCIEGDEIVHLLLDAMAAGVPVTQIEQTVHIHPTVSELIPTLLGELKPLEATSPEQRPKAP